MVRSHNDINVLQCVRLMGREDTKTEDSLPCPDGTLLGVEGKLGVWIMKIPFSVNRLCTTLVLFGVYINWRA